LLQKGGAKKEEETKQANGAATNGKFAKGGKKALQAEAW
jgi:hypothetical protein